MATRKHTLITAERLKVLAALQTMGGCCAVAGGATILAAEYIHWLKIPAIVCMLLGVVAWAFAVIRRRQLIRRAQSIKAHGDVTLRQRMFDDKPHEYRVLSDLPVPSADYYFYDSLRDTLTSNGFVWLGDIENLTISRTVPALRTFTRTFSTSDQMLLAEIRHTRKLRAGVPDTYMIGFITEFDDGCICITNNAGGAKFILRRERNLTGVCLPTKTNWEDILRIHREIVALMKIVKPAATCNLFRSVDDAIQIAHRRHSIIAQAERDRGFQKQDPKRQQARRILEMQKAAWGAGPHELRLASLSEFPNLDHAFYERFREDASAHGFIFLCDQEDMTMSQAMPYFRSLVRSMRSSDGSMIATAFHIRNAVPQKRAMKIDTELTDGTFITTANVNRTFVECPGINVRFVASTTTFPELLAIHRERVRESLTQGSGVDVVRVNSVDELRAMGNRAHAIKSRHKQARGFVGAEDLIRMRGRKLTPHELDVVKELEKLKGLSSPPAGEV